MIPALTLPVGANHVVKFDSAGNDLRNFNLNDLEEFREAWPQVRLSDDKKLNRWLHSDLINIGYLYNRKLFDKFVEIGGLDEIETK